jgi:hypothetical protein
MMRLWSKFLVDACGIASILISGNKFFYLHGLPPTPTKTPMSVQSELKNFILILSCISFVGVATLYSSGK